MAGDLYNADNVVVGDAVMYYQPWVATSLAGPVDDDAVLFDDTEWLALGYVGAGATHEGYKMNLETSTTTITIEEQSTPVGETVESKAIGFEAALAEDTMETMRLALEGSDITVVAAGSGTPGTSKMTLVDDIRYWEVGFEMRNKFGLARRFYIPKMSIRGSGETSFRRAADKRTYPVRANSICKPTDIQIIEITAPALP